MKKTVSALLTLLACLGLHQAQAQTSPGFEVRNLKTDFGAVGDGTHDDSQAFANASAFFNNRHGYGKLVIPNGTYRVGLQLPVGQQPSYVTSPYYLYGMYMLNLNGCSHLTIQGGTNTIIKYRDGLLYGTFESNGTPCTSNCTGNQAKTASIGTFFNIVDSDSLTIKNLELDGNNLHFNLGTANQPDGYQISSDGVFITGSSHDITIAYVNAHHFGRDGIMIANSTPNGIYSASNNILLAYCNFEYNGRQGLSWVGGKGLTAYYCKFNNTGRGRLASNPGAGVDFEPETGTVFNGLFSVCEFSYNYGSGIISDKGSASGLTMQRLSFNGSYFLNNRDRAVLMRGRSDLYFANCLIAGSVLYTNQNTSQADAIKFINTSFTDEYNGQTSGSGTAILEFPEYGNYLNNGISMANYAYFNACDFTVRHKMWMYIENTPYNAGNCNSYDPAKFILFQGGSLRYDPTTVPGSVSYLRGASFMGNWSMGPYLTSSTAHTYDWRDNLIQGQSNAGTTTLLAAAASYNIGCAGLVVGATDQDAPDLVVESGNTLFVMSNGQLSLRKKGRIIIKSGATLFLNQNAQLFFHGKIQVESGGTISIHPTVQIYADPCEDELSIAPGAIVQGRTDFRGTNVNVTGGHAGLVTGGTCAPSGNTRLASALATTSGAKLEHVMAYPNPFSQELLLSLPASSGRMSLQIIDAQGRVVAKQQVEAGTTTVTVGRELAAGLYSVLVQAPEGNSVLRIEKN